MLSKAHADTSRPGSVRVQPFTPSINLNKLPKYPKPKGASDLPSWFKEIRAGSDFMPTKVKPLSYNYLSLVESPNRQQAYSAPNQSNMQVGTMYHRPSDKVGTAIKSNLSVWQDIKNLGGQVLGKSLNLLGRVGDVLSRPLYAISTIMKNNYQDKYMNADSAGGSSVTAGEHARNIWDTLSPVGIIANLIQGRGDEMGRASWAGMSGKEKTDVTKLIKLTEPEFAEAHPKLTGVLGFTGSLALDPLTWVTMGANPGSVTRLGLAGLSALKLDKAGAVRALESTVFTKTGRTNSYEAIRSDSISTEWNRLTRKKNAAETRGDKIAAGRFGRQANQQAAQLHYQKAQDLAQELQNFSAQNLKGAQLAGLMVRQHLRNPLRTLSTASRFTTAAHKAGVVVKAGQTVKESMDAYHLTVANSMADEEYWDLIYESMKGKDIEYTHGRSGKTYKVDLANKDNKDDWLLRIVQEAAPIAKMTETGMKQAKSRKSRIGVTEARARAFISAFNNKLGGDFLKNVYGPKGKPGIDFDPEDIPVSRIFRQASPEEMNDPRIAKFTEDEWAGANADEIMKRADSSWGHGDTPEGGRGPKRVIVVDDNGVGRVVDAEAAVAHLRRTRRATSRRIKAEASATARTPAQAATDTLSGVDERLAAYRAMYENHFAEVASRSPRHATAVAKFIDKLVDYISGKDAKNLSLILGDNSIPLEVRIAKVIGDDKFSDRIANEALKEFFDVYIKDGKVHVVRSNADTNEALAKLPEVVRQVVLDRFEERIVQTGLYTDNNGRVLPSGILKAGNVRMFEGKILVNGKPIGKVDPNYTRDLNSEIGLALLDGVRSGLHFAMRMELMKNNPEAAFDLLMRPVEQMVAGLTADMRAQVVQLMYNLSGLRLPENFVPTVSDISNLMYGTTPFEFRKVDGTIAKDQDRTWNSLFHTMQTWPTKLFGNEMAGNYNEGFDTIDYLEELKWVRDTPLDKRVDKTNAITDEELEDFTNMSLSIDNLWNSTWNGNPSQGALNGNTYSVRNYSMLDLLMHHEEIIKAQETTLRVTGTKAESATGSSNKITRVNAGRLSALDSFGFVDESVMTGLQAIKKLKKIANKDDGSVLSVLAQQKLVNEFFKAGGDKWLFDKRSAAPEMRHISRQGAVLEDFYTLGAHAALKEGSLHRQGSFGSAYAAQLMEHLWGQQSLIHEWQKSLHNSILAKALINGDTPETIAKELAKAIDDHFINHDRIKRILHPVVGEDPILQRTTADLMQSTMKNQNRIEIPDKQPESVEFHPNDVLQHPSTIDIKTVPQQMSEERQILRDIGLRNQVPSQMGPTRQPSPTGPTGPTEPPPDVVVSNAMEDPADFVNTSATDVKFTDDESNAIRDYIAGAYGDNPPTRVKEAVDSLVGAAINDLYLAQLGIIDHMKDMSIHHKANIRFMGVPFMPIINPMNAHHAIAGVTTMAQHRSMAIRMWQNILAKSDPGTADNSMSKLRAYMTRESNLVDEGLRQIYRSVVNAVQEARKEIVQHVNNISMKLHDGEYAFGPMNTLNRKQRMNKASAKVFDPQSYKNNNSWDQFDMADGSSNPLLTILGDFANVSRDVFQGLRIGGEEWDAVFRRLHTYLPKKFQLTQDDLNRALTISQIDYATHPPFTGEWWALISNHPEMQLSAWRHEKMKTSNLVELNMALRDGGLRVQEGRRLYKAVWEEFGTPMTDKAAEIYNQNVANVTHGLRSPLVKLADIKSGGHGIPSVFIHRDVLTNSDGLHRWVSSDFIPEIRTLVKFMDGSSKLNETLDAKLLNQILNHFKASVTIYKIPSYPIRNLIADVFLSAMDGAVNPLDYRDAARIVQNAHQLSKDIDRQRLVNLEDVVDGQVMRDELARNMNDPDFEVIRPETGAPMTNLHLEGMGVKYDLNDQQIYGLYDELGLGMNRTSTDIKESVAGSRLSGAGRFFGKAHDKLRMYNDYREDWARLAHFIYALKREAPLGGTLEDIARRAGNRVIKHHFDYNDVSLFGRRVLAQWIPFYKWIRNIIPYTLTAVIARPYVLKAEHAITGAVGSAMDDDPNDPRTDFVVPDFIRNDNPVDIGWYSDPNGNKFMQWMSVSLPLSETLANTIEPVVGPIINPSGGSVTERAANTGAGALRVLGSSTNPIVSGAMQAMTGRQVWPGSPRDVPSPTTWAETMANVIPGWASLNDLTRAGTRMTGNSANQGMNQTGEFLDFLGAVNVQNNTENLQIGEVNRIRSMNLAQRNQITGQIKNKIAKKYPQLTPDQVDLVVEEYLKMLRAQQKSGQEVGPLVDVGQ